MGISRQKVLLWALVWVGQLVGGLTAVCGDPPPSPLIVAQADGPLCTVGNPYGADYLYGNWVGGSESFAYLIDPAYEGCHCPRGFLLLSVAMELQFSGQDVPQTFAVLASLAPALWDPTRMAFLPGPPHCGSQLTTVSIDTPGRHTITVELDGGCPGAAMGVPYFAVFTLPHELQERVTAPVDGYPRDGTCYHRSDQQWVDLVDDLGWRGKLIMQAVVSCTDQVVSSERTTLGGLKARYR
jgi:hypothetical protein